MRRPVRVIILSWAAGIVLGLTPITSLRAVGAPTSVTTLSTPGTGAISVTWTAVPGATEYKVRAGIGTNANNVTVRTWSAQSSAVQYTFSGLEFNLKYAISVQARDADGWGVRTFASSEVIVRPAPPAAPSRPTLRAIDDEILVVEWDEPPSSGGLPITSYSVQMYKGSLTFGEPQSVSSTSLTVRTNDKTSEFSATVSAVNEGGVSSNESVRSASKRASRPSNSQLTDTSPNPDVVPVVPTPVVPVVPTPAVPAVTTPVAPAVVTPTPAISYTKTVKPKSTVSFRNLASLGKLSAPKDAKISVLIPSSSKKVCATRGTSIITLSRGTCSAKVTVTLKSGKKSSRTIKLIAR